MHGLKVLTKRLYPEIHLRYQYIPKLTILKKNMFWHFQIDHVKTFQLKKNPLENIVSKRSYERKTFFFITCLVSKAVNKLSQ